MSAFWRGFSVVEIVTAAALATATAFAVLPGYVRSSEQAQIAWAQSELRRTEIAIRSYFIDHEAYPASGSAKGSALIHNSQQIAQVPAAAERSGGIRTANSFARPGSGAHRLVTFRVPDPARGERLHSLTSPIGYMEAFPTDPFAYTEGACFGYFAHESGLGWILFSLGPDRDENASSGPGDISARVEALYDLNASDPHMWQPSQGLLNATYDPTNGIFSNGDLWRVEGM